MYTITKDGDGFLAQVKGYSNLFAFGFSKEEAKQELIHVVDMMIDWHNELLQKEKNIRLALA